MEFKLAVFDLAGTTLHDDEELVANAFIEALNAHGIKLKNNDIRWIMGYRKIEALKMLISKEGEQVEKSRLEQIYATFLTILRDNYTAANLFEVKGISALFKKLKSHGILVAINTGFDRAITELILIKLKWISEGLVDAFIASNEVSNGRPSPEMIQKLMKQFGIEDSRHVIKVGDTPSDLEEGYNAGCGLTIGVLYGTHRLEELQSLPNDALVSSVDELEQVIFSQLNLVI